MSPKVLVVDDSAAITSGLRMLLEASGYEVRVAASAQEAAATGREFAPDAVLLDLTLPDGDGLAILDDLAASGSSPRVVFAMTGHDDAATRERCTAAGCDLVLVKPVPTRDLLRILSDKLR